MLDRAVETMDKIVERSEKTRYVEQIVENGEGIDRIDHLERKAETDLCHGSGFGLWLVDWILERSNGDPAFDVEESGTTVRVTLEHVARADGHENPTGGP